ncbi:MAG: hypothetical protein IKN71_01380 [Alphaproteobacteria bacterium]|nr:hypothetical protein [Alphaproteobacteria bacterium]
MLKKILFVLFGGMFFVNPVWAKEVAADATETEAVAAKEVAADTAETEAAAAEETTTNDAKASGDSWDVITYYYKNKDLNKALDIIKMISDSKILEQNPNTFTPSIGFVLGVIAENEGAEEKINELELSPEMRKCVEIAENLLKEYSFETILTDPTKVQNERGLDLLWGVFFATGNAKIPETIRAFVENNKISKAPVGKKNEWDIVVLSAIWSLESNGKQHEIVAPYAEFPEQNDGMGNQNAITFYKEIQKRGSN